MNALLDYPGLALAAYWGWALFHSIWQLALVAVALACVLRLMKAAPSESRYAVMLAALALMLAVPAATFFYVTPGAAYRDAWNLLPHSSPLFSLATIEQTAPLGTVPTTELAESVDVAEIQSSSLRPIVLARPIADLGRRVASVCGDYVLWAVCVWALGVLALSLRLVFGGLWILKMERRLGASTSASLQEAADRLRRIMKCSKPVRIIQSALVEVPTVLGWVRPVILFPAAVVAGLTPRQLEMVIAHEIAHLVRHDPFINALQTIAETILFYHPAVWWLSRHIREEREHCCDDMALAVCEDPVAYARTLALLESQRSTLPVAALSVAHGSLTQRIQRLLNPRSTRNHLRSWMAGLVVLLALCAVLTTSVTTTVARVLANYPDAPDANWAKVNFPGGAAEFMTDGTLQSAGTVCIRRPGATSFFDWADTLPASGDILLPPDVETALRIAPERFHGLEVLDTLPPDLLSGLLAGEFFHYRAGNEPLEKVYANVLQTQDRSRMPLQDGDLAHVVRLSGLRDLYLDHSFVTDAGIAVLGEMNSLETLSLTGTDITDGALAALAALPSLRRLDLTGTAITDEGLAFLASATALEELTLDRTAVTDAGVGLLTALPNLQRVSLNFTVVTDWSVSALREMPSMPVVRAWHTQAQSEFPNFQDPGAEVPRVGIILSEFTAGYKHSMQHEYSYQHSVGIAQFLIDLGYDVYAVIDPGTEEDGYLPQVLTHLGLEGRVVNGADPQELAQIDVVVSGHNPMMRDDMLDALLAAVKDGLGFVNTSVFGNRIPQSSPALCELLGIDNPNYSLQFEYVDCTVAVSHPILGNLQPGDTFTVKWLNGASGEVHGTPLLITGGEDQDFCPLYVQDLGAGTVVNVQWQQPTIGNGDVDPEEFYGRCVNFAAGAPADAVW